jgi:hypothetical protein
MAGSRKEKCRKFCLDKGKLAGYNVFSNANVSENPE